MVHIETVAWPLLIPVARQRAIEAGDGTTAPVVQAARPKTSAEPPRVPEMQTNAGLLSDPQDLPAAPRRLVRLLFSLIQVMYFSFYIAALVSLHETQRVVELMPEYSKWLFPVLLVTALVGIPVRLYLLTGAIFGYRGLTRRFLHLFPFVFPLDELWALSPFLIVELIGVGLALAATAMLVYILFSQRILLLMGRETVKLSRDPNFEKWICARPPRGILAQATIRIVMSLNCDATSLGVEN